MEAASTRAPRRGSGAKHADCSMRCGKLASMWVAPNVARMTGIVVIESWTLVEKGGECLMHKFCMSSRDRASLERERAGAREVSEDGGRIASGGSLHPSERWQFRLRRHDRVEMRMPYDRCL